MRVKRIATASPCPLHAASFDRLARFGRRSYDGDMEPNKINLVFRAFSDPTRLRILRLVQGGECCVGDLVAVLRLPQPSVSRHLAYLRKAGLVAVRKAGLWSYYRLSPAETDFLKKLFDCLDCCLDEVPDLQEDARRAAALRAEGGCCPDAALRPAPIAATSLPKR